MYRCATLQVKAFITSKFQETVNEENPLLVVQRGDDANKTNKKQKDASN